MKKIMLAALAGLVLALLCGCNDFAFMDVSDGRVTLTYQDREYACIASQDCGYDYDSSDMVYLFSVEYGEFNDKGEAYNVYRHTDDETPVYLFIIPKPSIRDATPYAFVLKATDSVTPTPQQARLETAAAI
jgi:hypothetical protein